MALFRALLAVVVQDLSKVRKSIMIETTKRYTVVTTCDCRRSPEHMRVNIHPHDLTVAAGTIKSDDERKEGVE